MKILKNLAVLALAAVLVTGLAACDRNNPLENVTDAPTDAKADTSLDAITQAILAAGNERGWQKTLKSPGLIRAKLITGEGKHVVEVDIAYSRDEFSITYADSFNMNYQLRDGEPRIHPKYNRWVQILKDDIQQSIKNLS